MSPPARPAWITGITLVVVMVLLIVPVAPTLRLEIQQARIDQRTLPFRASYTTALTRLETRSFQGFMRFARQRIPAHATVLIAWDVPDYGYYRGSYDLYPRHVWDIVPVDIVATRPALAHARPRVNAARLRQQLQVSGATYLLVWRVPMPLHDAGMPPIRRLYMYRRPYAYIAHLAWALKPGSRLVRPADGSGRRPTALAQGRSDTAPAIRVSGRHPRPAGAGRGS